jgi:hypothetical protein
MLRVHSGAVNVATIASDLTNDKGTFQFALWICLLRGPVEKFRKKDFEPAELTDLGV